LELNSNCVTANLVGYTVGELLGLANKAIAGNGLPSGVSFSQLSSALTSLNQEYDGCASAGTNCFSSP